MRKRAGTETERRRLTLMVAAIAALLLAVPGCGAGDNADGESPTTESSTEATPAGPSLSGTIIVSAAASLTDAFSTIRDDFETEHPDAEVTLNFGSSGALATQIREGAPADVAAFADTTPMTALADAGLLSNDPAVFATNRLVIVTKPGNPAGITGLADLANVGTVSLCVETAPCGKFADQILDTAAVTIPETSITRGTDVKSTLTAVTEGDAVAAIVYVTDAAAAADQVDTVDLPDADNVVANYPIAAVEATANPDLAQAFVDHVLSDDGRSVLEKFGFLAP